MFFSIYFCTFIISFIVLWAVCTEVNGLIDYVYPEYSVAFGANYLLITK